MYVYISRLPFLVLGLKCECEIFFIFQFDIMCKVQEQVMYLSPIRYYQWSVVGA